MKHLILVLLSSFTLLSTAVTADETPKEACKSASSLYADGDIEGALEEARWCVSLLEQEQQNLTNKFFLDDVDGYKGGTLDNQNAMGFSLINRSYQKGSKRIDVSLNAGTSGAALQAFSAIAQLGTQFGNGKKIRIQKRSAIATNESGTKSVTVTLRSGGMLHFESSNVEMDALIEFAKEFPVAELDDSKS
jgi:hypothetical protein